MKGARYYLISHPCGHQTPVPGTWFLKASTADQWIDAPLQ